MKCITLPSDNLLPAVHDLMLLCSAWEHVSDQSSLVAIRAAIQEMGDQLSEMEAEELDRTAAAAIKARLTPGAALAYVVAASSLADLTGISPAEIVWRDDAEAEDDEEDDAKAKAEAWSPTPAPKALFLWSGGHVWKEGDVVRAGGRYWRRNSFDIDQPCDKSPAFSLRWYEVKWYSDAILGNRWQRVADDDDDDTPNNAV